MRFIPLLLITLVTASAQTDMGKLLEEGMRGALTGLAPVPEPDRSEVLKSTAGCLVKHLKFRPDGTAASICTASGTQQVEWKRFVVRHITAHPVTEADRLNDITKRYLVGFSCDAHRSWDSKANAWGKWSPIGHVRFPSAVTVERKGGKWVVLETDQIRYFRPGPGPAIVEPKTDTKSPDLPPGMTRGR